MLLMLLIGWTVVFPAVVVAGLYVSSSVLGRRARMRAYEDLLPYEDLFRYASPADLVSAEDAGRPAAPKLVPRPALKVVPPVRPPVGAGY